MRSVCASSKSTIPRLWARRDDGFGGAKFPCDPGLSLVLTVVNVRAHDIFAGPTVTSFFSDPEELERAVDDIAKLSPQARTALAKLIEHGGVEVERVSPTMERLFDLGFVQIEDKWMRSRITPSVWAWEALGVFEERNQHKKSVGSLSPGPG